MKIAIGSDHAGFALKSSIMEYLCRNNYIVTDIGAHNIVTRVDYPDFAKMVAKQVATGESDLGILVCGTGIGMCITANKTKGVRAAVVTETYSAKMSRVHNNANVLCLGARVLGEGLAIEVVDAWLHASFEGGRHKFRVDKIEDPERG